MGILSRLGQRAKALSGTPAVLEALDRRQVNPYISLGSSPNARRATDRINSVYVATQNASYGWIYAYSPSVRRVIDYVARNVSQLGLKVYKRVSDDEREHVGNHPAAQALRWPNSWTPGQQFIFDFVVDFLIYDNAYALKFPANNGELTLVNIPAHLVGLVGQSFYQPEGYRIWDQDGNTVDVPVERMVHWRGKNPTDPRRGESKLETLREELAADAASRQATTELHRSGLALPGWVERPLEAPEWSEEAADRWVKKFSASAKKATREVPVLEEGMVFKQGGVTPEDAELLAGRRFTLEQVAGLYGMKNVPPESEEERKQFYADVLPPITEILAAFLDLHVLIREYGAEDHYIEFNLDEKLMGDDRLKALTSAAGAPPLTRNEARARLNLPAKKGGDELITPLNVTVGGKPSPQVMPVQDPNKPSQDGSHRIEDVPQRASLNGNGYHPERKQLLLPRRADKERRRDDAAKDFEKAIGGFLSHMERSLKSKGMDAKAVADNRWDEKLAGEIEGAARRTVQREGEITAARLASTFDMGLTRNYLRTVSEGKAKDVVKALRSNLRAGETSEVFKQAREVDTPRGATTLATALTSWATLEAGRQDPESERRMKTWIVTSGNSEHPEMDGESVPLGESFSNGTDGPPADHAGCLCMLEIDGGGHPPVKAIETQTKGTIMPAPVVNVTSPPPPDVNIALQVSEGAFRVETPVTVAPPPPAEVYVTTPEIKVAPAQVHTHIEEGAVSAPVVNVEAPSAPEVYIDNPTVVEAPPPAEVRIDKGAIEVNVAPADVNVEAAPAPNVNVEVKGGKTKKTVTFSDGKQATVEEEAE